jgi:hypothetical protein
VRDRRSNSRPEFWGCALATCVSAPLPAHTHVHVHVQSSVGAEGRIKPFHEYYSINTPDGYTRGGDFVSTRRYDPMVGAVDSRGSLNAGEKMSRKMIAAHDEAIRLKGPDDAKRLLAPGESSTSDQYACPPTLLALCPAPTVLGRAPPEGSVLRAAACKGRGRCRGVVDVDGRAPRARRYTKFWERQEARRIDGKSMKEESANNQTFFGKKQHAPKMVAQTRYMPLEVEHRDEVQKELMRGVGPMLKIGHGDDLHQVGAKTSIENETLFDHNVHKGPQRKNALTLQKEF